MAISSDQLKFYKSLYINDSVTNGGRISSDLVTNNAMNNLFRNIQYDELQSGIVLYRKFFIKNENPLDIKLENPKIWISNISSGEDYFTIIKGTDTDNQEIADDYTDWCGCGVLATNVGSGENVIDVTFKQVYGIPNLNTIRIFDNLNNNELEIVGEPIWNGSVATITLNGEVGFDFLKDTTLVSSIVELDNLETSVLDWLENSILGVYDESSYPLILYNIGTITESWTLTFKSSSSFEITGAVTGSIGYGSINAMFSPSNGAGYYFTLSKYGWGGSWLIGDTITFKTVHSAQGIWIKEDVPAGCNSQSNNMLQLSLKGESA